MSKLERYLEFNWPTEFRAYKHNDQPASQAAIHVMRNLDQRLGGKDAVIAGLVEAAKTAAEHFRIELEDDPSCESDRECLEKLDAALAKAGKVSE